MCDSVAVGNGVGVGSKVDVAGAVADCVGTGVDTSASIAGCVGMGVDMSATIAGCVGAGGNVTTKDSLASGSDWASIASRTKG